MHKDPSDIISYEQIESLTEVAAGMGIRKVRLTGGEPLLRKDVEHLVARLAAIQGIEQVCMTTNGSRLAAKAEQLKQNGLARLNVSIVSLDAERYRRITGGGDLHQVLAGVDTALKVKFTAIKINMVVLDDTTEEDIERMAAFCRQQDLQLQTIMRFSLYDRAGLSRRYGLTVRRNAVSAIDLGLPLMGAFCPVFFQTKRYASISMTLRAPYVKLRQRNR